jgi:hypothetical protein
MERRDTSKPLCLPGDGPSSSPGGNKAYSWRAPGRWTTRGQRAAAAEGDGEEGAGPVVEVVVVVVIWVGEEEVGLVSAVNVPSGLQELSRTCKEAP